MNRDDALFLADLIRDLINHTPRTPNRDTIADAILGGMAQRAPKAVAGSGGGSEANKTWVEVPDNPLRYNALKEAYRLAGIASPDPADQTAPPYKPKPRVMGKNVMAPYDDHGLHPVDPKNFYLTDCQGERLKGIRLTESNPQALVRFPSPKPAHKPDPYRVTSVVPEKHYRITDIRRNPNLVSTFDPRRPLLSFKDAWPGNTTLRFPNEIEVELGLCAEDIAREIFRMWQKAWADEAKRHIS